MKKLTMKESYSNEKYRKLLDEKQREIRRLTEEINHQREAIEAQKEVIETQRDVAIKQRDEISYQKKEMTASIKYAERIQTALLPTEEVFTRSFKDYFIMYRPKDIVSGDFYWITTKSNRIILVAADCTGHGVPGGFMSIMGVAFLNEIIDNLGIVQPGEILNVLRDKVISTFSPAGKKAEAMDGMDISVISYDPHDHILQFAGAFNPVVIIRDGEVHDLAADRMPVGFHFGTVRPFKNVEFEAQPDDSVYLFSDGYVDQFGWRANTKYKMKNFKQLLQDIQQVPMRAQKVLLENNLDNWKGELDQLDDIMVIGIQL
jgi:serine phosphatase RsbU (regulator of sigma subunit)